MNFTIPNFSEIIPELTVFGMAIVILLADLFMANKFKAISYVLTQLTLVAATVLTILEFWNPGIAFDHTFINDHLAVILKIFIYATAFLSFVYARAYIRQRKMPEGEYYVLGLFSVLGMMIMVSSQSLLTAYMGIELLSLPLYAMIALHRSSAVASESAFKFFVTGALASGMLLYGMSLLYGLTGTLDISQIAIHLAGLQANSMLGVFAMIFIVIGIMFKLGAVPFHMWVPDVYHGAPTSVTAFISAAPKIAAYGIAIRLLVEAMPSLQGQWQHLLIIIAVASMALGNIMAIAQVNIKRMLAYSSIAHIGYMTLGLVAGTSAGYSASMFYILIYALMSLGGFGVIILLSRSGFEAERLDDLRGLNARSPWLAFMMLLLMFSMAGVPPLAGFFIKLGVLEALVNSHFVWLAVLALIFAIIGAYYYLRVVKIMYFEEPAEMSAISVTGDAYIALSVNALVILLIGVFPSGMIHLCQSVFA